MDNTTHEISATADTAEAEQKQNAATVAGKFKSVDALLAAYNSLEAEFTRRSQRLKELERAATEAAPATAASAQLPPQPQPSQTELLQAAMSDEKVKEAIVAEYLVSAAKNKSVPLVAGGISLSAHRKAPATVSEAGALAQQFLNKRR